MDSIKRMISDLLDMMVRPPPVVVCALRPRCLNELPYFGGRRKRYACNGFVKKSANNISLSREIFDAETSPTMGEVSAIATSSGNIHQDMQDKQFILLGGEYCTHYGYLVYQFLLEQMAYCTEYSANKWEFYRALSATEQAKSWKQPKNRYSLTWHMTGLFH